MTALLLFGWMLDLIFGLLLAVFLSERPKLNPIHGADRGWYTDPKDDRLIIFWSGERWHYGSRRPR
jgi:hypothetical protein